MTHPLKASPDMPATWTPEVAQAALEHAGEAYPAEAIGAVKDGAYHPLANTSDDPTKEATLSGADMVAAATADLLFHSHPDGPPCPSRADMELQAELAIPFVILPLPGFEAFAFGDQLVPAPLDGRAFRHGVHDCYSLCRDWYRETHGLLLPDQPRDWEWWFKPGFNLYVDGFDEAGFVRIDKSAATQVGDGLLYDFGAGVPQHAAIVVADDLILHHASGRQPLDYTRPSARAIRSRYQRYAVMGLRHKNFA